MNPQKISPKKTQSKICNPLQIKDLPDNISQRKVSHEVFSMWVRQLLLNVRQGTVHVKSRADVSLSGRKPWKQKGTGRARAGTARSPLWRGGGIIFGPRPRIRTLSVSRKAKRGILNILLYNFVNNQKVLIADWALAGDKPKTKEAISFLQQASIYNQSAVLFVTSDDLLTQASFANIPNVQLVLYDAPNAYNLISGLWWLVLKKDRDLFIEMVKKWR